MAEKKPLADYGGSIKELQAGDTVAVSVTMQAEPPSDGLWFSTGVYGEMTLFLKYGGTWRKAKDGKHLPDAVRCHRVESYKGKRVLSRGRVKASKIYKHIAYL